ncbi:MAG: methyltransferase [Chitinophagaceae bacterium]|nr:methyltransferase [Chitinophagaceae bacterium]
MPNNYFQFKQFTVYQDRCAMKVCTDACLFGAYVTELIIKENIAASNILDIGSGTGLLTLMLAQKTTTQIDAVEIDEVAYQQAANNFSESPWGERLHIFNDDITAFRPGKKYDCIISNPPFFEDDLKSVDKNKNAAKHDTTLTLQQLLSVANAFIIDDGIFAVLLPIHRVNYCMEEAAKLNLFLHKKVLVKQTPTHDFFRGILIFSNHSSTLMEETITIKNDTGNYSERFEELLKDYYLYL